MNIELYTPDEIAEMLRLKRRSFLRTVATRPDFPTPVRLGPRTVRWEKELVDLWIDQNTQRST